MAEGRATEPGTPTSGAPSPGAGLRVLAVDDEPPALAELVWLLEHDPDVGCVVPAGGATAALQALDSQAFDAVFCDITMPGMDGMTLARVLARFAEGPAIVFVTAHAAHAVDAFDISAADYVLKPVRAERLHAAVSKVVTLRRVTPPEPEPVPDDDSDETIPVERGRVTTFLQRSQVRWVQAVGDYVRLHTADDAHLVRVPLSRLEERWTEHGFARIHRSTLVSLGAVSQVRTDPGRLMTVILDDGTELTVSRRHIRSLRERLLRDRGNAVLEL